MDNIETTIDHQMFSVSNAFEDVSGFPKFARLLSSGHELPSSDRVPLEHPDLTPWPRRGPSLILSIGPYKDMLNTCIDM